MPGTFESAIYIYIYIHIYIYIYINSFTLYHNYMKSAAEELPRRAK